MKDIKTKQFVQKEKPFASVLAGFSEAFVSGKFCDVKVVCKVKSPFLTYYHKSEFRTPISGLTAWFLAQFLLSFTSF